MALQPSAAEFLEFSVPPSRRLHALARAVSAAAAPRAGTGAPLGTAPAASAASGRLAGKSVLVTGGGTGIGQGIVLAFAAEGAHVVATGRRTAPLDETVALAAGMSGTVESLSADISDRDQTALITYMTDKYGQLDILVNNAGVNIPKRSLAELSVDDWHSVVVSTPAQSPPHHDDSQG